MQLNKYLVICIVYLYLIISSEIKDVQNKMYHETFYSKLTDLLPALVLIVGSTPSACSSISSRVVGILNAHSRAALFLPCCCCCPLCCCSCSPCGCCGLQSAVGRIAPVSLQTPAHGLVVGHPAVRVWSTGCVGTGVLALLTKTYHTRKKTATQLLFPRPVNASNFFLWSLKQPS